MSGPTLPAGPLVDTLHDLYRDPYMGGEDVTTFAAGIGLDARLVASVLTGGLTDLDVDHVAQVCEGLRCSPFDLWGPDLARTILHVYGPERWPRHIEPLDEGRRLPGDDTFMRRRLEQRAAELHEEPTQPAGSERLGLVVTAYTQTGVVAVGPEGRASSVEDTTAWARPDTDYHFAFRQVAAPEVFNVRMSLDRFAAGGPAGHDADPVLAQTAAECRRVRSDVSMVRFTAGETGEEQWLGWNEDSGTWHAWGDPRVHYPGDAVDVLDPCGCVEPPNYPAAAPTITLCD